MTGRRHILAPDFAAVERLAARGVDTARIAVVPAARAGPPLPPRPYDFGLRCLVVVPTYNEAENIETTVEAIRQCLACEVLVVDDASPDGTGRLAAALAAREPRVHVLHRRAKLGLGGAYVAGFRWALERDFDRVIEMDGDLSHPPWDLPRLVHATLDADLAVGSRYVPGGATAEWRRARRWLSRAGNLYARMVLGAAVRDWTAGFRCYRRRLLRRLDLAAVDTSGYAFQIQMTWLALRAGGRVREIPIRFVERAHGTSKMDARIVLEALLAVPRMRFRP